MNIFDMSNTELRISIATESPRFGWKNVRIENGELVGDPRHGFAECRSVIPDWPGDLATACFLCDIMESHSLRSEFLQNVQSVAGDLSPTARQLSEAALMTLRNDVAFAVA